MKHLVFAIVLVFAAFITLAAQSTPKSVADELLAADRAFSAASAKTDLIAGISAMFAADIAMPAPGGIAYGSAKAIDALKSNPANAGAKAEWTPVRVAVSGDGRHGFTAGLMTITRADGTINAAKYLTYWEKQANGWRALTYKRVPSPLKTPSLTVNYLLPAQIGPSKSDAAAIERDRESLAEAERTFSRDAQTMGIGPAFTKYGHAEAINVFGGTDAEPFTLGNVAIGQQVASPAQGASDGGVNWGPEKTFIAPSGDFGVTVGYIMRNKPPADGKTPPLQPFFTIWKRDSPSAPWRYIAE